MAATESISEMQTQTIKEFIGKWPKADRFIVVVKKTLRYSNVFFYNRTRVYAAIPSLGTFLWKAVKN
jgi:hypothetical protein